jgi:hypothetical protein
MKSNFPQPMKVLLAFSSVLLGMLLLQRITEGPLPPISWTQLAIFISITAVIFILGVWISLLKPKENNENEHNHGSKPSLSKLVRKNQGIIMAMLILLLILNVYSLWTEWPSDTQGCVTQIFIIIISLIFGLSAGFWAWSAFISHKKKRSNETKV